MTAKPKAEEREYSGLFIASENLEYKEVARLLAEGRDPNKITSAGWLTLHQAIDAEIDAYYPARVSDRWDDPPSGQMVELYLQPGVDPYLLSPQGGTLLTWLATDTTRDIPITLASWKSWCDTDTSLG